MRAKQIRATKKEADEATEAFIMAKTPVVKDAALDELINGLNIDDDSSSRTHQVVAPVVHQIQAQVLALAAAAMMI